MFIIIILILTLRVEVNAVLFSGIMFSPYGYILCCCCPVMHKYMLDFQLTSANIPNTVLYRVVTSFLDLWLVIKI
jgi:hypothetical protein